MINHLSGGQGFVDPLRLARKINQELHTVGLNVTAGPMVTYNKKLTV